MNGWGRKVLTHSAASLFGACTCFVVLPYLFPLKNNEQYSNTNAEESIENTQEKTIQDNVDTSSTRSSISSQMHPKSPITIFTPNPNLQIAFDARTKSPLYVMERFPQEHFEQQYASPTLTKSSRAGMSFREETRLPPNHRSRNGYYRNSGFDRGHMAPAADFPNNQQAMKDTFSLCNVSPQVGVFNRVVWSRLEALIRKLAKEAVIEEANHGEQVNVETYVVTGPLSLPERILTSSQSEATHQQRRKRDWYQYSHVGFGSPPSIIQVPSHFFKVICTISERTEDPILNGGRVIKFAAFVLPNSKFEKYEKINLQDFLVRISDLETLSGLQFFPALRESSDVEQMDEGQSPQNSLAKWDVLTEEVWMEISNKPKGRVTIGKDTSILRTGGLTGKSQRIKNQGMFHEEGDVLSLQHFCKNNSCHEIIKIPKYKTSEMK